MADEPLDPLLRAAQILAGVPLSSPRLLTPTESVHVRLAFNVVARRTDGCALALLAAHLATAPASVLGTRVDQALYRDWAGRAIAYASSHGCLTGMAVAKTIFSRRAVHDAKTLAPWMALVDQVKDKRLLDAPTLPVGRHNRLAHQLYEGVFPRVAAAGPQLDAFVAEHFDRMGEHSAVLGI